MKILGMPLRTSSNLPRYVTFALFIIALVAPTHHAVAQGDVQAVVRVERSDKSGVVLRIGRLQSRIRTFGKTASVELNAKRFSVSRDTATLPSLSFTIAVPQGASGFSAEASEVRRIAEPVDLLARNVRNADPMTTVGSSRILRNITTVTVNYSPLRAQGGLLTVDTSFVLTLRWKSTASNGAPSKVAVSEIPAIEDAMRGLVVNYDQAKSWRAWSTPAPRLQSASSGWGIGEAMVLLVPRDGIYRITADELANDGARSLTGTPIAQLALHHRNIERALFVADADRDGIFDPEDYLEFIGERNRGTEGLYFDAISDTNAYVLSWDQRGGATPRVADTAFVAPSTSLDSFDSTLHFEREIFELAGMRMPEGEGYWEGDVRTVHVPERVTSERLYWIKVAGPRDRGGAVPFDCSPVYDVGNHYLLRVRLSNVGPYATPIRVALNGYANLGSFELPPRSDTLIEITVPASYLINGTNDLGIASLLSDTATFEIDVDYVEVKGRWRTSSHDEQPRIRIPFDAVAGVSLRVRLNGLRHPASYALSARSRVNVDSSDIPGLHFRVTSRMFYQGALRENYGFAAEFGDTSVRSGQWAIGAMMAEVDPAGRLVRSEYFRTAESSDAMSRAADFINAVSSGNFIVAGSVSVFGFQPVPQAFRAALASIGSTFLSNSGYQDGAWAYVGRKGDLSTVREKFERQTGPERNGVTLDEWTATPQGNRYRAVFTIAGQPGEEFIVGTPARPAVRYHDRDQLVGNENQADLIIITHPAFRAASERLAAHRRTHGPSGDGDFSVRVVDVHTVYDEFNHGIKNHEPIRSFLQYADTFWVAPKPGYVLLFGDASFDPERRLGRSKMFDYVPTYGEPASDYWYTIARDNAPPVDPQSWPYDTSASWRQFIGRLPAMSPRDADVMVDKMIEYDTMAPAEWNKRVIFVAGGANFSEVDGNVSQAESIARNYITASTFDGDTTITRRRPPIPDVPSKPPHPDSRWAQQAMAEGGIWSNSAGHGSRTVLDLDFGTPAEIDNGNRYFVLGTFSCQTGAFSEIEGSLRNEDFVKEPGRGAIASFGATGWSFEHINAETEEAVFSLLTIPPYINNLGALTTFAKYRPFAGYEVVWLQTPEGVMRRTHLLTYSLLGDPSMDLKVSKMRELAFTDARVSNGFGSDLGVQDSVATVAATLWNYGRPILVEDDDVDSLITVVGTIIGPDRSERRDTHEVRWLRRSQQLQLSLPLDGVPGEYTIRVEVDPKRQVQEGYRADNIIVLPLRVRGNQPLPIEPVPSGRVASYDDVVIRLLNPPSGAGAEITVDTVATFDAAAFTNATVGSMSSDDLTTTWSFAIPASLRASKRFWWRAIATSGDLEVARLFPLIETFTVEPEPRAEFMLGDQAQFAQSRIRGVVNDIEGVGPQSRAARVQVRAIGQTRYPTGEIISDTRIYFTVISDDGATTTQLADNNRVGIHIGVLDPSTLARVMYNTFLLFEQPAQADSLVRFIESIPAGYPVLLGTMGQSLDGVRIDARILDALSSIGAQLNRDSLSNIDSYALIGGKGMPAVQSWIFGDSLRRAREGALRYAIASTERMFLVQPSAGDLVSPTIGPATAWRSAKIVTNNFGAMPDVTVFGVRRDGVRDSVATWRSTATVDLRDVDVVRYPRLELRTEFPLDSSMRVRAIEVDFDPSPELAVVPQSIALSRDSILQGDEAELDLKVANLSRRYVADSVAIALSHVVTGLPRVAETKRMTIAPLERRNVTFDLVTDNYGPSNMLAVLVNPGDSPAEPYRHNNADTAFIRAGSDSTRPRLAIYADGQRMMDGDYVSPTALFEVRLFDNSRLRVNDTGAIMLILDLNEITLDSGAVFTQNPGGDALASFSYAVAAPGLADGEHSITYRGTDASGNRTEAEFIRFNVASELKIVDVVNYPNPFRDKTEFTFRVGGASQPTAGEISIYTVAGRRIKTIKLGASDVHLGFNHIEWDGLDGDRDRLANGVYLYRLMIENVDGRAEVVEKLVVMR